MVRENRKKESHIKDDTKKKKKDDTKCNIES